MDDQDSVQNKIKIDKNILDLFWKLCENNSQVRINASADILHFLWKRQILIENANELAKDLEYSVERLIRGLASSRDSARLGYTLLLTEILRQFPIVQIEEVLELMKKHLSITGKQEKKDVIFGQLFAYTAIVRSGRLPNHNYLSEVVTSLLDLSFSRNYILNTTYEVFVDLFAQLTSDNFKEIWSCIKKKLPSDWESLSAQSLWLLLLCIRKFPDAISSKYMGKHWGKDLFSSENLNSLKKVLKQSTSTLPKLHPTCIEFILLVKQRSNFQEIWNSIIDDNLFVEHNEKSFVGFEMVKFALEECPTEEMLEIVLSSKFRSVFSKAFLNNKHPLNPAASQLAEYLCTFVKTKPVPNLQILVLRAFLQPPGTVLLDQVIRKKEVSMIIQNLLPEAVKELCNILKSVFLQKKSDHEDEKEVNNMKRFQASQQISNLITHPATLTDTDWRLDIVKFLFLHSFFTIKETSSEIPHCDSIFEPLSDALRDSCMTAFFKAVNSLHVRSDNKQSSLNNFVELLIQLIDYAEILMNSCKSNECANIEPKFSLEKVLSSWPDLKKQVHKLKKKSKKDNMVHESNAFLVLFLQLGLHLFQDPDGISEVLEELDICCKKSLKTIKDEASAESDENEPPWIGVVIDILLSLLSRSSNYFRSLVTYIFPHFCPFIDRNALQQILDVINPTKKDEDMLVEDNESEGEDLDFGSGSSSEGSEDEEDKQPVDDEFRKKVQEALGPAADDSDAESVVLSDTEMFKLDDALSSAFKSRVKAGHTQIKSEEKSLLHFRVRCLDLILSYLKSEPPMHLVLMCLEPVLAAFELGHKDKHQGPLLHKAVSILQFMTKMRKFQHHENVSRSELKRLLDVLIPKCHKEINLSISQKLASLCVFIVLCYRKVANADSPDKKKSKTPSYMKIYLTALETFVSSSSSHMMPHFFTHLMEACPEIAWYFAEPCKNYAFNNNLRLFKRTQCLGLLFESLKYSKSQKDITDEQWYELANNILPFAVESLKTALESEDIKPTYCTELLNIIYTLNSIIKEKTNESLLQKYSELLPLLNNMSSKKQKKLQAKGNHLRNRIILCLGGSVSKSKKAKTEAVGNDQSFETENKSSEQEMNVDSVEDDLQNGGKKKKKRKLSENSSRNINSCDDDKDLNNLEAATGIHQSFKVKKKKSDQNDNIVCIDLVSDETKEKHKKKKKNISSEINCVDLGDSSENEITVIEPERSGIEESPKKKKKSKELNEGVLDSANNDCTVIQPERSETEQSSKKKRKSKKLNKAVLDSTSNDCTVIEPERSGTEQSPKKKRKSMELNEAVLNSTSNDCNVIEPERSETEQSPKKKKKSKELNESVLDSTNSDLQNSGVKKSKKK